MIFLWIAAFVAGIALIVWGADAFAEHLGGAAAGLGVSSFALALLLAGAEPEELATVVTASLKGAPGIAVGNVIGANVAIYLIAWARSACGATTRSVGRNTETHLHSADSPTPKSDDTRRRESPLLDAIRIASRLKSSVCFIISPVSLIEFLTLKSPAQNRYKSSSELRRR